MAEERSCDFSEKDEAHVSVLDRGSLHRVLNARHLFAIGFGDVGSSIYYALGVTALYALGATPVALAIAGLVFICTVLTYAELSTMMPESGGSCVFAHHAYNDLLAFIAGWALLLDYVVTIAISAYSIGPYVSNLAPGLVALLGGNIPFALISLAVGTAQVTNDGPDTAQVEISFFLPDLMRRRLYPPFQGVVGVQKNACADGRIIGKQPGDLRAGGKTPLI